MQRAISYVLLRTLSLFTVGVLSQLKLELENKGG
jgi:hypothetical protein